MEIEILDLICDCWSRGTIWCSYSLNLFYWLNEYVKEDKTYQIKQDKTTHWLWLYCNQGEERHKIERNVQRETYTLYRFSILRYKYTGLIKSKNNIVDSGPCSLFPEKNEKKCSCKQWRYRLKIKIIIIACVFDIQLSRLFARTHAHRPYLLFLNNSHWLLRLY